MGQCAYVLQGLPSLPFGSRHLLWVDKHNTHQAGRCRVALRAHLNAHFHLMKEVVKYFGLQLIKFCCPGSDSWKKDEMGSGNHC